MLYHCASGIYPGVLGLKTQCRRHLLVHWLLIYSDTLFSTNLEVPEIARSAHGPDSLITNVVRPQQKEDAYTYSLIGYRSARTMVASFYVQACKSSAGAMLSPTTPRFMLPYLVATYTRVLPRLVSILFSFPPTAHHRQSTSKQLLEMQ